MKYFVQSIFKLPPVDKRRKIPALLRGKIVPWSFKEDQDDMYVYYLCFERSLIVCSVFALLNWISYTFQTRFDFYFFVIELPRTNFIEVFTKPYAVYMSTILLLFVLPFHLILLRKYVNPKKADLLRWNLKFQALASRTRRKILPVYFKMIIICLICMYGAFGLPLMLIKYEHHLYDSYHFFLLILLFFTVLESVMTMTALICCALLWRYIGPYEGK